MSLNRDVVKAFDTYATAVIDGEKFGPFDSWDPPDRSGNTQTYRPGGRRPMMRTRGLPETDTGTLVITLKSPAEKAAWRAIYRKAGYAPMSVTEVTLNADGEPADDMTWDGLLEDIEWPEADADSEDNQQISLTFAANEEVA